MDYIVNIKHVLSASSKVNAQSKAREDVTHTLKSIGAKEIEIFRVDYNFPFTKKCIPLISGFLEYISICLKRQIIKSGDRVFFQDFRDKFSQFIIQYCRSHGASVHVIVHDVHSVRFNLSDADVDVATLNTADQLYVHTECMVNLLKKMGVKAPMKVMHLFDYYSNDAMMPIDEIQGLKNIVVFAGNLAKSGFLQQWIDADKSKYAKFNLYGILGGLNVPDSSNFKYHGPFKPEQTGSVKGGWGLVWDGDSIDTCTGSLGNYLRYNSSHKFSLYITCGFPLIAWEESSLASWIKEEGIGICISKLSDIDSAISGVSDEEYRKMLEKCRLLSEKLRNGGLLKSLID